MEYYIVEKLYIAEKIILNCSRDDILARLNRTIHVLATNSLFQKIKLKYSDNTLNFFMTYNDEKSLVLSFAGTTL